MLLLVDELLRIVIGGSTRAEADLLLAVMSSWLSLFGVGAAMLVVVLVAATASKTYESGHRHISVS